MRDPAISLPAFPADPPAPAERGPKRRRAPAGRGGGGPRGGSSAGGEVLPLPTQTAEPPTRRPGEQPEEVPQDGGSREGGPIANQATSKYGYVAQVGYPTLKRGGQKGRKGSRSLLANSFFRDLYGLWEEQGEQALRRAAFHDPVKFVGIVAQLMPQKIEVTQPTDGMSDERFEELIAMAEQMAELAMNRQLAQNGGVAPEPLAIEGQVVEVLDDGSGVDPESLF